ncbi:cytochrome P450 CYP82D47-like [Amaranthus tricolor]|uniref:cytochrome P450 CYP82D47-like n=1 Tax=Amaranthus tricolor TaxID=29722 RepID=UPI00258B968A|nr:cytochrome P450 CYP82D47-like [Amaranthus tricolor]
MLLHLSTMFSTEAISLLALLVFFYCIQKWKKGINQIPPKPSGSWPIIGHLHLLGKLPHITLGKLADQYGPIFMIKLGVDHALVVSSAQTAKECLSTNDRIFASRPQTIFNERVGYNSAMFGLSPYGPYWREMKKIITVQLLSNHQLEMHKQVRISEVKLAIKALHKECLNKVDMKQWFSDININASVRLVAGASLKEFYKGEEYNKRAKVLRDFFELAGTFVPGDFLPFLRWLDIGGYEKAMKKVANEIDNMAQFWLDHHKQRRLSDQGQHKRDFLDVLLNIFEREEHQASQFEEDIIIKATCMTIILAATDTIAVTLTWALSLLLNNKDCLRKAQKEIEEVVGKERQVEESDLNNLVYLQAVLKETMRLYPAGPLSVPREAITDCTINGYKIQAGTRLLVNLYKIQRDPQLWDNPLEFHPERFLTSHIDCDFRGQNFELMPFGSGRRMCPGISYALKMMLFVLANLLHGFDVGTSSEKAIDMTEGYGLTNMKATPLEVILSPRLPSHVYDYYDFE